MNIEKQSFFVMTNLILKCIASSILVGAAVLLTAALEIESVVPAVLILFGSLSFFFGEYMTSAGFTWGFHRVDTETPETIWKLLGVLLWIAGAFSFVCLSYHS